MFVVFIEISIKSVSVIAKTRSVPKKYHERHEASACEKKNPKVRLDKLRPIL